MSIESEFTPIENYPFLNRFRFNDDLSEKYWHGSALENLLEEHWTAFQEEVSQNQEYLAAREKVFAEAVSLYFNDQKKRIIQDNLIAENSFVILGEYTRLVDSVVQTVFDYTVVDLPLIKERLLEDLKNEIQYKRKILPEKQEKLRLLSKQIEQSDTGNEDNDEALQVRKYYEDILDGLHADIRSHQERLQVLEEQVPQIEAPRNEPAFIKEHLVIFARGGYGRAELSLSSDHDIGYCLDTHRLNSGEAELLRQVIMQVEMLLQQSGVETAHQYFEIDEDLSRFNEPSAVHTIPSILESRVLLGNQTLAVSLKNRFFQIITYETYVLNLIQDYHDNTVPSLNSMNLKMDHGGLRSLQIPLWVAAATFGIFPSQTADLLALLIQKNLLSSRQGLKLCQALEFLHDLRNFSAAAKENYYDNEARDVGCIKENLEADQTNDAMERLYLLKKNRFKSVDEFDRFRLQMVQQMRELSQVILDRLMDRTIVRTFPKFQVVVHLGNMRVVEVHALEGLPQVPVSLIFSEPDVLLELFIYLGNSDYDLTYELKDEMASLIRHYTPDRMQINKTKIAEKFSALMQTPFVSRALGLMFEISDLMGDLKLPQTLIGCYIPECNQMRFLLRNLTYHQHPVCTHTLLALQRSQRELDRLRKNYPELYQFLKPRHILALRWGLLFHDIGKIDPKTEHQVSGTQIAAQALQRLGYDDPELENLVSLLIVHHMSVVHLSKTSSYFDQALQSFFEIADRNLINVILLFLCNISDYSAVSDSNARDTRNLRNFFEETYRVYSEMRASNKKGDPIDFIHDYLDKKKKDLETDTRIDLLINRSLRFDLDTALVEPLKQINVEELERIQESREELTELWRALKLGSLDSQGVDRTTDKMIRTIRHCLSNTTLTQLTANHNSILNWFFETLPNRFLLSTPPGVLASNLQTFTRLDRPAIVSVLTNSRGRLTGLLLYVHDQPRINSRVAYTLSMKRLNIESGKMNKIHFQGDRTAYCYYLKVSTRDGAEMIFPRELENAILHNPPPDLKIQPQDFLYNTRLQMEYLDDDQKGYVIQQSTRDASRDYPVWLGTDPETYGFTRKNQEYLRVKLAMADAPLVYFKMVEAFERIGAKIQQAVITTIGHQVIDTFYLSPEDHRKLRKSDFEEHLKHSMMSPSEI